MDSLAFSQDKIFKVSEFNDYINLYLDKVGEVVVEGEISQINISQGKWLFLTIKDEDSSVEVFGYAFKIHNFAELETGMLVRVYGTPRLYTKTGRFSLSANQIMPSGLGALQIAFEKLKSKLEQEGLFASARKRPLPAFPERIGLITAKNSQAYADFVKVLGERIGGVKIYFYPVSVQGRESVASLLSAFVYFNSADLNLDLLVLVRGGGSLEDLLSFNDEQVVRAIFSSRVPVVCGIGHEKDESLADFAADLRASTPSNAAELIVRERSEVLKQVEYFVFRMESELLKKVERFQEYRHFLDKIEGALKLELSRKNQLVSLAAQSLNDAVKKNLATLYALLSRFQNEFNRFIQLTDGIKQKVSNWQEILLKEVFLLLKDGKMRIASLLRLLKSLDHRQVLKRGFSITTDSQGNVIKLINQVSKGKKITTRLFSGKIYSKVFLKEEGNG